MGIVNWPPLFCNAVCAFSYAASKSTYPSLSAMYHIQLFTRGKKVRMTNRFGNDRAIGPLAYNTVNLVYV